LDLFRFVPGYRSWIYHDGREPLLFLFLSLLIAFLVTRAYTRLARVRGWGSGSIGGVHLHHSVVGIVMMFAGGLMVFTPGGSGAVARDACALVFGAGAALVLDEFALVFYLRDVYWSQEGRDSVNATLLGLMVAALGLVISDPFGIGDPTKKLGRLVFFSIVAWNIAFATITFLKGKPFAGSAAIFLPVIGILGAVRLAKPRSPWARWFYRPERAPAHRREARALKEARAEERAEHGFAARFEQWLDNTVGGSPSPP